MLPENQYSHEISRALIYLLLFTLSGVLQVFWLKYAKFQIFHKPLDFGQKWRGKSIFGKNKTFSGLIGMALSCMMIASVFAWIRPGVKSIDTIGRTIAFWGLLGVVYMLGELPNSFMKRRLNIAPGETPRKTVPRRLMYVIDQTDSVACVALFVMWREGLSWVFFTSSVIFGFFIHAGFNVFLWKIRIKSNPR